MSKLTRVVALTVLAFWGLAVMHCKLEALPGLDFLKCCRFADSEPSTPTDCESDGCGTVENGGYRVEEQTASAPQPLLVLALRFVVIEPPLPELRAHLFVASRPPPELATVWQFSLRAALPPRAPSTAS